MNRKLLTIAAAISAASALTAGDIPALTASLNDAVKAGNNDKIIAICTQLRADPDFKTHTNGWSKWQMDYRIMLAQLDKLGARSWENVCRIADSRPDGAPLDENQIAARRSSLVFATKDKKLIKTFLDTYKNSTNKGIANSVSRAYSALGDQKSAFSHAEAHGLHRQMFGLLNTYSGITANDNEKIFNVINIILDDPKANVDLGFADTVANKTLINLFVTGKIKKEQFVGTLKKLYRRSYLNLAKDRGRWEPVVSAVKFGIVNADKIASIGE